MLNNQTALLKIQSERLAFGKERMQRFIAWLEREVQGPKLALSLFVGIFFSLFWAGLGVLAAVAIAFLNNIDLNSIKERCFPFPSPLFLAVSVLIEEAVFRLPLAAFVRVRSLKTTDILFIAAGLSAIFGYLHGGFFHIFSQGVIGFIFSIVFLKGGGLQKKIFLPFFLVLVIHYVYDAIIFAIASLNGESFC